MGGGLFSSGGAQEVVVHLLVKEGGCALPKDEWCSPRSLRVVQALKESEPGVFGPRNTLGKLSQYRA